MMKKIFIFLVIVSVVFTGCTDNDIFENAYSPANVGDEIAFGGSVDFKSNGKQTRTVYGPKHDGVTDIKWYEGDMVRIYCEQALDVSLAEGSRVYCDYVVTGDNVISTTENPMEDTLYNKVHTVTLANASNQENGLRWGTVNPHKFYGVYPSPKMLNKYADDEFAANLLKIERNKVSAYLPNLQRPLRFVAPVEFTNGDKGQKDLYVIHPSMRYAYMVAYGEGTPDDGGVDLCFNPIVTAVEMTLENMGEETISGITLLSLTSTQNICGNFTTTIEGTPTLVNTDDDDASVKVVNIPVASDESSINLKPGDRIKFTAFLTLSADINELGVVITYANGMATKKATLKGNGVDANGNPINIVQAKRKNFISNVPVNFTEVVQSVDIAHWMKALPDETVLDALSIPGAGGASSGNKLNGNYIVSDYARQQNLSIEELWRNGIRCFEFFVDKGSSTDNFKAQTITCNGVNTGVTLIDAVNNISSLLLNNPEEFAVVIIGYEEAYNNVVSYSRNAGSNGFGDNFNNWWNSYSYKETIDGVEKSIKKDKILPECTTLSDARGRLFCIGRPISIGIDPGWYTGVYSDNNSQDLNCLYVLGWGNNPDQWYARGFGNLVVKDYKNTTVPAGENTADRPYVLGTTANGLVAPDYTPKSSVSYYTDSNKGTSTLGKYVYKATQKTHVTYTNAEYSVKVQEWRRVMPTAEIQLKYNLASPENKSFRGLNNNSVDYYAAWAPSVDEKWNDVVTTFESALRNEGNYNLYINSLCGYFIDGNIELSYQPRPTFQRYYYNKNNRLINIKEETDLEAVFLDDKYRNYGSDSDAYKTKVVGINITGGCSSPTTDSNWGPYNPLGGYQGNIAAYSDWINNKFYNYLLGCDLSGSIGVVMMDRVSNDVNANPAGYYIPRIILANNPFGQNNESIDKDIFEDGDVPLARKERVGNNNTGNITVVWE